MATVHEPPKEFVSRLRAAFPDFHDLRYNWAVQRWEFQFLSVVGKPVSQFFGWDHNPLTGDKLTPDPATLCYPFRDLTPDAQDEIIKTATETCIVNNVDGTSTWANYMKNRSEYNRKLDERQRRERGETFSEMIAEVKSLSSHPGWLKEHGKDYKRMRGIEEKKIQVGYQAGPPTPAGIVVFTIPKYRPKTNDSPRP